MNKDFELVEQKITEKNFNSSILKETKVNINQILTKEKTETFYTTASEHEHITTIQYTLLHHAMIVDNLDAFIILLAAQADITIPMIITSIHRRRPEPQNMYDIASEDDWREEKTIEEKTTLTLAKDKIHFLAIVVQAMSYPDTYPTFIQRRWRLIEPEQLIPKDFDLKRDSKDEDSKKESKLSPVVPMVMQPLPKMEAQKGVVYLPKYGTNMSFYRMADRAFALRKEYDWQKAVVKKFFKIGHPLKAGKSSSYIFNQLIKQIQAPVKEKKYLFIDRQRPRSLLIALAKILSENSFLPTLHFQFGHTFISLLEVDESRRSNQRGNCKMVIAGRPYDLAYGKGADDQIQFMCKGHWEDGRQAWRRERKLVDLLSYKIPSFQPFSNLDFNQYNNVRLDGENPKYDKDTIDRVHFLNGLIFLITIVEVIARLYRDENGNLFSYKKESALISDDIPIALAQARSLLLLFNRKIKLNDLIGESKDYKEKAPIHRAKYGIATGKQTIIDNSQIMLSKLEAINQKYHSMLFNKEMPAGKTITGRRSMYADLVKIYGNGAESDDEYSSEDDELKVQVVKCR